MRERWKDIKGYDGLYMISDVGKVKSCVAGMEKNIMNVKRF